MTETKKEKRYLTADEIGYIKTHPLDPPSAIARHLDCSVTTVYRHLHRFYGDVPFVTKEAERERRRNIVREMYPTHSAADVAKVLGVSRSAVTLMAASLGIKHTPETTARLVQANVAAMNRPEAAAKRDASRKRGYLMERFRICNGEPTKYRYHYTRASKRSIYARKRLVRSHNYYYDKDYGDALTLFYDEQTRRLPPEREQYYMNTYHIKFECGG